MIKNLLIIGYYELKEHLLYISENFTKYNYNVNNYPLFQYAYDSNNMIDNYMDHLNNFIKEHNIDIILWWFLDVPINIFKSIKEKNPNIYYILYNTDDPINFNMELIEKCKNFNLIITPCKGNVNKYKLFTGIEDVYFYPHCYDPNYFFQISNIEYDNDICMVIYNLYDSNKFKYQYIEITDLINNLINYCNNNNKKLGLYGSYILKELYNEYYKGNIEYKDQNSLFNKSKINIYLRCNCNMEIINNDLEMKILASGSLLCIDKFNGMNYLYQNMYNCIVLDQDNYIDQINNILMEYNNQYKPFELIKKNAIKSVEIYTWDSWVTEIHKYIMKHYFDEKIYIDMNKLNIDINNAWDHWINIGLYEKYLCHDFVVPDNFDHELYLNIKNIKSDNIKYIYYDWFKNSKDPYFLKTKNIILFNVDELHCTIEIYHDICSILNKIKDYTTRDKGLLELSKKCNECPYININLIIEKYFENI